MHISSPTTDRTIELARAGASALGMTLDEALLRPGKPKLLLDTLIDRARELFGADGGSDGYETISSGAENGFQRNLLLSGRQCIPVGDVIATTSLRQINCVHNNLLTAATEKEIYVSCKLRGESDGSTHDLTYIAVAHFELICQLLLGHAPGFQFGFDFIYIHGVIILIFSLMSIKKFINRTQTIKKSTKKDLTCLIIELILCLQRSILE